jgi:hypothetical protein
MLRATDPPFDGDIHGTIVAELNRRIDANREVVREAV